jgi:hypothetical protein
MSDNFQSNLTIALYITILFYVFNHLNLFKRIKNKYIRLVLNATIFGICVLAILYTIQNVVETFISPSDAAAKRSSLQSIVDRLNGIEKPSNDLLNQCDNEFHHQGSFTVSQSSEPIDTLKNLINIAVTGALIDQSNLHGCMMRYEEIFAMDNPLSDKINLLQDLATECQSLIHIWSEDQRLPDHINEPDTYMYLENTDIQRVDFFAEGTFGNNLLNQIRYTNSEELQELQNYINHRTLSQMISIRCQLVNNIKNLYNNEITTILNSINDITSHENIITNSLTLELVDYLSQDNIDSLNAAADTNQGNIDYFSSFLTDLNGLENYEDYYQFFTTNSALPGNFSIIAKNIDYIRNLLTAPHPTPQNPTPQPSVNFPTD